MENSSLMTGVHMLGACQERVSPMRCYIFLVKVYIVLYSQWSNIAFGTFRHSRLTHSYHIVILFSWILRWDCSSFSQYHNMMMIIIIISQRFKRKSQLCASSSFVHYWWFPYTQIGKIIKNYIYIYIQPLSTHLEGFCKYLGPVKWRTVYVSPGPHRFKVDNLVQSYLSTMRITIIIVVVYLVNINFVVCLYRQHFT